MSFPVFEILKRKSELSLINPYPLAYLYWNENSSITTVSGQPLAIRNWTSAEGSGVVLKGQCCCSFCQLYTPLAAPVTGFATAVTSNANSGWGQSVNLLNPPYSFLVVFRPIVASNTDGSVCSDSIVTEQTGIYLHQWGDNDVDGVNLKQYSFQSAITDYGVVKDIPANNWYVACQGVDTWGLRYARHNFHGTNTWEGNFANSNGNSTINRYGEGQTGAYSPKGYIAEIISFNTFLSAADMAGMVAYIKDKYALA